MKWLGALKSQLWLIRGRAGLVGGMKMLRAAMARFSGIFLPPQWHRDSRGSKTSGKESKKEQIEGVFLWSTATVTCPLWSPAVNPTSCSPLWMAGRGWPLCTAPSTHVWGKQGSLCPCCRAKSHRNGSYCNYSLPEHMVSGIFPRVKCMNMHRN